jgi:hypothetical protein
MTYTLTARVAAESPASGIDEEVRDSLLLSPLPLAGEDALTARLKVDQIRL